MSKALQLWLATHDLDEMYEPLNTNGITVAMLDSISTGKTCASNL
jgi:hypothetical protein